MNSETIDGNEQGFSGSSVYVCEYLGIRIYVLIKHVEKCDINIEVLSRAYLPSLLNSLKDISWMD